MDGGLVNPLPFDMLDGRSRHHGRHRRQRRARPAPASIRSRRAFDALVSSSQILQRSIVREKLKAQQPDIYIDVEVDEFYVLDFHRFKQILAAAEPAKEQLRRQLERVLASHTVGDAAAGGPAGGQTAARKRRLPSLKRLRAGARHERGSRGRPCGRPGPRIAPGARRRLGARARPRR